MTDRSPYQASETDEERPSGFIAGLQNRLHLNAAVVWAVITRIWQVGAGGISFVMIASFMTAAETGYYFTFWSFIAAQSLVDLGFTIAILNFSSHEWSGLELRRDGGITGDPDCLSRLVSLGRLAFVWFGIGMLLFAICAGVTGEAVFSATGGGTVQWRTPWWLLVALSALSLWAMPFLTILEGCGQVETVYRFRFFQAVAMNAAVWVSLWAGLGIWTAVVSASVRLVTELLLLLVRYRTFFLDFYRTTPGVVLNWRQQIWPMQWRLAVGGLFNYFAVFMFSPVMFYHSETLAGQMGMTRQLLMAMQGAAQSWVQARVPLFGRLIAQRKFAQLDDLFRRLTIVSTLVLLAGGVVFLSFLFVLRAALPAFGDRLLPPLPTAIMLLAMLAFQLPYCQTLYLRAHRREPVMWPTVASNLGIAAGVAGLGLWYAATGAALGHLLPVCFIAVPLIHRVWVRCRREWHTDATLDSPAGSVSE